MPNDRPSRHYDLSAAWGFAIAAAVIVIIMIGYGWTGQGRGWGRNNNQLAHMMPPAAVSSSNGPASRSNSASANLH